MAHSHRRGIVALLGVGLLLTPAPAFAQMAGRARVVENDAERFRLVPGGGRWRPLRQGGSFSYQDDLRTLADSRLLLELQKSEFTLSPETRVTVGGSRGQPELLVHGGIARVERKSRGPGAPVVVVKSFSGHEGRARSTAFVVSCPGARELLQQSAGTRCGDRTAVAGECIFVGLFGEAEVSRPGGAMVELGMQECTLVEKGRDPPPPVEMALSDFQDLIDLTSIGGITQRPRLDCISPDCRPPVDDPLLPLPLPPPLPGPPRPPVPGGQEQDR